MRQTIFTTVLFTSFAAASIYLMNPVAAASNDKPKYENIQVRGGNPNASELGISPTRDSSKPSGYLIPETIPQAVIEIKKMLSQDMLKKIIQTDGLSSSFYNRGLLGLSNWLYKNWHLDSEKSSLGNTLRSLGFGTSDWMGEGLFEAVYDAGKPESKNMLRLGRIAFAQQQDELLPLTSPPVECISQKIKFHAAEARLGSENTRSMRNFNWVACEDGTKLAYLWERGWFVPDRELLQQIEASQ